MRMWMRISGAGAAHQRPWWVIKASKWLNGNHLLSWGTCFTAVWLWCAPAQAQVVISEFLASNKSGLMDEDGDTSDWIELYNTGTNTVNLSGWALSNDPTGRNRWSFPSTNILAHGFMVVFASGKDRAVPGAPLHTSFSLRATGEYLALLQPGGAKATEFGPAFPEQFSDISYGIAQEVSTNTLVAAGMTAQILIPTDGSLGADWTLPGFDASTWPKGTTGIGYEAALPGFAVHNYLANVGVCSLAAAEGVISQPAQQRDVFAENPAVINYENTGGGAHYGNDRTMPGLVIGVDADNYVLEARARITIPNPGNWTFGVNSDDGFSLVIGGFKMSYPDPRGPGDTLATFNFPAAGDYDLRLVFYECGGGSEVELYAAPGSYAGWDATHFRLVGDTANGGLAVYAPPVSGGVSSGYKSVIQTDVQSIMKGINSTAYLRVPFSVADPAALNSLTLRMMYDDGFVAYLNGEEVARRNAPSAPQWNSAATAAQSSDRALNSEEINISDHLQTLKAGENVLAIQGLNHGIDDGGFLIVPEMVEYRILGQEEEYFSKPTPGAPNGTGFYAFVAGLQFDPPRGFYSTNVNLAITSATADATIRYTTNGTVPSMTNGFTYTGPLPLSGTTVVRAAGFKERYAPSGAEAHTYLFLTDVIRQSPNGARPPGWPASWGANVVDYGMDPNVVNNTNYSGTIIRDLQTIPSYCLTMDLKDLFDPAIGIYANAYNDGRDWERPGSVELIYPDGRAGFQINAGIRMRGGYSRSPSNPKHAFRFFFRDEYGQSTLHYPVFASQNGVDSFNKFDLRTFENYSWSFEGDSRGIFLRDQFSRDTQIDMGQAGERGDFYHLYINGQYWGLYNTAERPEAAYAASYFGGSKDEYDTIKVDPANGYTIFATDGNMEAWTRLWKMATNGFSTDAAYQKVQGRNPDGTRNPAYEVLLEIDPLIDYMLVIYYGGNLDAPISNFLGNQAPNNWFGFRHTNGHSGFRFIAHDSEHTLLDLSENRTGPFPAGNPAGGGGLRYSNPQYVFQQLWTNVEFRMRCADRIQKHFFNGGLLTPEACTARFMRRKNEIDRAVVGESARWGDSKVEPPRTRNKEWIAEVNRILKSYFPQRTTVVLGQLRNKKLYPTVAAPVFSQFGGEVTNGFQLTITSATGTIYYTRDGGDPRLPGGALSPTALIYNGPLSISRTGPIRARVFNGTTWSAMNQADFVAPLSLDSITVSQGTPPAAHLTFKAEAGKTYTVQYMDSLSTRTWLKLTDVPSPAVTQSVEVTDAGISLPSDRYYRLVTPAQP